MEYPKAQDKTPSDKTFYGVHLSAMRLKTIVTVCASNIISQDTLKTAIIMPT